MNVEQLIAVGIAVKWEISPKTFLEHLKSTDDILSSSLWTKVEGSVSGLRYEVIGNLARLWSSHYYQSVGVKLRNGPSFIFDWREGAGTELLQKMATATVLGILAKKAEFQIEQPQFTV